MKAKSGFNLRNVCGQQIIVAEGDNNIDFSNIISMNETSAALWRKMQQLPSFTVDDMVKALTDEYDVDDDTARKDCTALAAQWGAAKIIEGDDVPAGTVKRTELGVSSPKEEEEKVNEKKESKGFLHKMFHK